MLQFLSQGGNAADLAKRTVEVFISGGAFSAGDWVMLNTSSSDSDRVATCIKASTSFSTGNPLVVGVALEAATAAGQKIKVVTRGYVEGANVATAVNAAGLALVVDGTAAGRAVAIEATDLCSACGVSLEAASSNTCDVFVYGLAR